MKKLIFLISILFNVLGYSQVYEAGLSYNIGSIMGETSSTFRDPFSPSNFGLIVKKNMNPRIAYRAGINRLNSADTNITEFSGGIDFNFIKYNLVRNQDNFKHSPYLTLELAALTYKNSISSGFAVALPIGIGYKQSINDFFIWSVEAKGRVTFSDDLDGIKTNKSTLDSFAYVSATIYYTFGWPKGSKNQTKF
ncbi:DUF6089 family protein [Flavobacteriaceae bacterium]|nr:DUF6089 family protein [Flavobacteriaceae bacterium]